MIHSVTESLLNCHEVVNDYNPDAVHLFNFSKLQMESTLSQDSTAFILAQIEQQNALLERDPKSIVIQSNKLKAHFSIMQKLVQDNTQVDWGFWEAVIQDSDQIALKLPHLFALKLRSGIPSRVRGLIWQAMSKSTSVHLETVYGQLCKEKSPHERVIQRDLARTFPRIEMFKQENGQGQSSLKRILEAYSLYDADVGYCQGLAFLIGPLLLNMPETQSFCVFVRLMETYKMRTMFTLNMDGLHLRLYQFSSLLKELLPDLSLHLSYYGVHPAMFASQWFLTLFAYVFPMELVNRIYDIVFAEGAAETTMRVAIAMLKKSEDIIQDSTEFEDILDYLTSRKLCDPYKNNYNHIIQDAMKFSDVITTSKLSQIREEYNGLSKEENKTTTGKFSFWRRKTTDVQRSTSDDITKEKCASSAKRWSSMSTPGLITKQNNSDDIQQLKKELQELRLEHQQTLYELKEAQRDRQCLERETIALKQTIQTLESSMSLSPSPSLATTLSADEEEFSCKFVQLKVENFELEQKCESLTHELDLVQSKLDMVNEGQIILFDKMITMKAEMEEMRLENRNLKLEKNNIVLEDQQQSLQQIEENTNSITNSKRRLSIYGLVSTALGKSS